MTKLSKRSRKASFDKYVVPELELLYRVALAMTGKPENAEDLVQETLLRAFRAIERFDGRHPRAWLLTILRNALANQVRKKVPLPVSDVDESGNPESVSDHRDSPEFQVVDQAFDGAVAAAFEELPGKFREVVALVDISGMSYAEAAARLGVPVGTVMSRLHRGRTRIREGLKSEELFVEGGQV
ncbi:MAG: sigma-70 family RNA polymerase sigma factor [Actinobacteria bacterium]|nr:sigma-70 family RNA polymerase sigma factor [Actinomycetota bacterium]